jgi:hypothetical protein
MKNILIAILIIGALISIPFISLEAYKYFAPRYEEARRDVFFNTPSYQLGKEQEARKIKREMERDIENKEVLDNIYDHLKN